MASAREKEGPRGARWQGSQEWDEINTDPGEKRTVVGHVNTNLRQSRTKPWRPRQANAANRGREAGRPFVLIQATPERSCRSEQDQ